MPTPPRITCLGEPLVDFVAHERGVLSSVRRFSAYLGGEGANVAVGLAKLGAHVSFVGKVGDDPFGRFLLDELNRFGVKTGKVWRDKNFRTRLAFVSLTQDGERDFAFWETMPAGAQLHTRDVGVPGRSRILTIAPLLLLNEPSRSTALRAAGQARRRRTLVAFDPNLRPALWRTAGEMQRTTLRMIRQSAIVRLNETEARQLTGHRTIAKASARLRSLGPQLVVVTRGQGGCYYQTDRVEGLSGGYHVKATDTTGCGDAFFAALLHGVAHTAGNPDDLTSEELDSICAYANACGALTATRAGAAAAMPFPREVLRFMKTHDQTDARPD